MSASLAEPIQPSVGDFVVVCSRTVDLATLADGLRDANRWPTIGGAAEVAVHLPVASVLVATRGGVQLQLEGQSGRVGLYNLSRGPSDRARPPDVAQAAILDEWRGRRFEAAALTGGFALALWNNADGRFSAYVDPFRSYPLYYGSVGDGWGVATDLRLLAALRAQPRTVNPAAIYHFLNYSFVPTPSTMFAGICKVPPGALVEFDSGQARVSDYWQPRYAEDLAGSDAELAAQLKARISESVGRYIPSDTRRWGNFLSGGTDSSSIAGLMSRSSAARVKSFSIGFAEEGFDELEYAQLAARRFELDAHTLKVSADDTLSAIPRLVRAFDEPIGNSSAIPTYYCANLAKQNGVDVLIAGDGGDEIFGGNERYLKDAIFGRFYGLPGPIKSIARVVSQGLAPLDTRLTNRVRNFVRRASLPNPERFYTDDSFASDNYAEMLSDGMKAVVSPDDSVEVIGGVYRRAGEVSELHRLMYIDLAMAIADNDIVKVTRAAKAAGVAVRFPYLDPDLVQFTGRLGPRYKLRGGEKRFLFKLAVRDVLPAEILAKKKKGFGIPVGRWFREHSGFKQLLGDVVLSPRAMERGYFQRDFVERLFQKHTAGTWDYGPKLWYLLLLELWHREHIDL